MPKEKRRGSGAQSGEPESTAKREEKERNIRRAFKILREI